MEITGKVILDLGERRGTSKAGKEWNTHEYVLETPDAFPRKVHFEFFGDRADNFHLEVGQTVLLRYDIDSREWNGKWFTSIRGISAEVLQPTAAGTPQGGMSAGAPVPPPVSPAPIPPANDSEDLPF